MEKANSRFEARFRAMEALLRDGDGPARALRDMDADTLDALWTRVKGMKG